MTEQEVWHQEEVHEQEGREVDLNKKMAELRTKADESNEAAKKVRSEAGRLYSTVDRIWAAKVVAEKIRSELMKKGYVALEPHIINEVVDFSVESLINGGHLDA